MSAASSGPPDSRRILYSAIVEGADGVPALILELVEGSTLAERLRHATLPVPESVVLARQIAEALEAAHEKGIVHRDLKPANLPRTPRLPKRTS